MTDFPSNNSLLTPHGTDENTLTLTGILDKNNVNIINKVTYQTSFKVKGIGAEPNSLLDVFDSNEKLGEARSNGSGEFESPLFEAPRFDCYLVRVKQSGDGPVSLSKKCTVATATPNINEVLSGGKPINDGDTIPETSVTINGNAPPNQSAEAFNDDTPLKAETANACGKYTIVLEDLKKGLYSITVKAIDDKVSLPFKFTVGELVVTPVTLDKVTTATGIEVPDNTETSETSLFVEGEGEKGTKVEVFKDGVSLGEADVNTTTGRYKHPTGQLNDGTHIFTVTAKYTGGGTAGPYTIRVKAATTAPTETRIYDAEGNVIDDGGDINKSWFIARGLHTPNSAVKIKLNDVIQPNSEPTNGEGKWAFFKSNLTVGSTYVIRALTEDETAESNPWSVKAVTPI